MISPITPDQARARAVIVAMAALVDLQDWDGLKQCFARSLTVDYTSLWGGEPQEAGRDELIGQWKALVPGFDATCHELGPVTVEVDGDEAQVQASVVATHLLDGNAWTVEGRYRCRLVRDGNGWRIAALAYLNQTESGDRGLTEQAKKRAEALNWLPGTDSNHRPTG